MFESTERLEADICRLLEGLRHLAQGRYACLLDRREMLFEAGEGEADGLRDFLAGRRGPLFDIPAALAGDAPEQDVFEGWVEDDFFLAFINGRVALVVACPRAEGLPDRALKPLRALTDRLLRFNAAYRLDHRGHGLFLGRPRLDMVVVERPGAAS